MGLFLYFSIVILDYSLSSSDVSKLLSAVEFYILILIFLTLSIQCDDVTYSILLDEVKYK